MKTVLLTLFSTLGLLQISLAQSDSAAFYFKKGQEEQAQKRYAVAYADLQKALQFSPTPQPEYLKAAALVALDLHKYDLAKVHFEKLNQFDSKDTTAIIHLAELNFATRHWQEAIKYATLMNQLHIGTRYNYIIGRSQYEEENYGESYKYLQAAAKDEPNNAEIPYLIARSFVDMSNYKMAVQFFDQALAKDTTKANWYYETALTYFAIPDAKKAIGYFEKAIRKGYRTTNDVLENLSNAYVEAGQPQKGIELMKQLLEKKPADMELLWNIAEVHYKTGKYAEAIDYWDRMLYYDKTNAKALYMIGLSYQKKGEKAKGEQLCDRAISMDPSLKNLKQKKELPAGL